jgi:hypothetical protein
VSYDSLHGARGQITGRYVGRKLQRLPRGNVVKTFNLCEKSEDRMSFLKVARLCVPAMALLVGCTTRQTTPSVNGSGVEFVAAFRQAHEQRDLEAMLRLFCGDRVTPEVRNFTEDNLKTGFDEKIADIRVTAEHPKGRTDVFVRTGITYRFNSPVVAELIIEHPPQSKGSSSTSEWPLALKEGHYCIAQFAPAEGSAAQQPVASSSSPDQATQPSPSGRIGEAAHPTVVPAKTALIVRFGEDIGLKTAKAGGSFSATVAEPVVVDGVTVISAGSPVQGIVSKKGEYGPEVTLTSLTVNNKSHKISTGSWGFNQEIVFPAGSQMKFELVFPLKLDQ